MFFVFKRLKTSKKVKHKSMIKSIKNMGAVKTAVEKMQNKTVKVTQNLGRNKYVSYIGVVKGVYPALFTVEPNAPYNGKTSFSYSDILCGNVKLKCEA